MTTITDFTNELHIRLYVAELLKDYVKDESFNDMAERMFTFITAGSNLPVQPKGNMSMNDIMSNFVKVMAGTYNGNHLKEKSDLEELYLKYRLRSVYDSHDRTGLIVGYSEDFNSLMELRELTEVGILRLAIKKQQPQGLENDFVDIPSGSGGNGFFYIPKEEVQKQCKH